MFCCLPAFFCACSSAPAPGDQLTVTARFQVPKSIPAVPQRPIDLPGLPNFGFVTPELWRGGEPTAAGLQTLGAMGAKTIIDLREADESADVPKGVKYIRLPTSSFSPDQVDVKTVLDAIAASPKPVFVHCLEGRDRTGMAIAAYRVRHGMGADDAITELRNFHVNFWWDGPIARRIRQLAGS